MSKTTNSEKWCPECGQMSSARAFIAFRCEYCVEKRGIPSMLPQYLLDYYGLTDADIKKYNVGKKNLSE